MAVQDHGYSPVESNRQFRFRHWEMFLAGGQPLETLLYQQVPDYLTRMRAIQDTWPRARVMDTGAAAILGCVPFVKKPAAGRLGAAQFERAAAKGLPAGRALWKMME